jgi:alpha-galactosidase
MENVVLIGAGSAMFTHGLVADMIRKEWKGELRLVDTDPEAVEIALGLASNMLKAAGSAMTVSGTVDRKDALPGASVVICTVGVGGRRAWEQDVFVPRTFGIYQPVGDTVMPGGSSRAIRMIPAMVEIAEDVLRLAPEALFFNYSNPMSPVCRGIRKATGANVIGLCHGVHSVARYLAEEIGADLSAMETTAYGINHLTWFTGLNVDGRELMPKVRSIAAQKVEEIRSAVSRNADVPTIPFTWELTNLTGAFPAVLDRHVVEFFPHMFGSKNGYYGKTLGVDCFGFEDVIERGDRIYAEMGDLANGTKPISDKDLKGAEGEHEQVLDIVESIRSGNGARYSANIPNNGQISSLPDDAVIECPCIATTDGLVPIGKADFPAVLAGTLASRFQWVELVVAAALEGSRQKFIQALLVDGSVLTLDTAERLADALLSVQSEYLPRFRGSA